MTPRQCGLHKKDLFSMDHDERSLGSDLRSAKDLELAGRLEEAAEIYRRLASDNPQNWEVRQRFARLSWNRQQRDQAFAWLGEAIEMSPDQPELHIEHADYLFAMGRLDEAQASIKNALSLADGEADYHVKLALVQLERRDGDGAWAAAQRAIELDPGHKGARQILGNLCWQRGELETAVEHFEISRERPKPAPDPNGGFASTLFALGRVPEIARLGKPVINAQNYIETMLRAVYNWQAGRIEPCKNLLQKGGPLFARSPQAPRMLIFHQVQQVLDAMVDYLPAHPDFYQTEAEAPLFLIGDNHVLPAAHLTLPFAERQRRAISILIVSMKTASLVRDEPNAQSAALLAALDRLPAGADVVLSAGELDTRYSDGLLGQLKADGSLTMQEMITPLVRGYLETSARWCRERNLCPAYLVQPAPNVRLRKIPSFDREPFLAVIACYVDSLRREAAERDLPIIDLYKSTSAAGGGARGELFIDGNHALPDAYRMAFENASA
jgi:Flp pilus assembly protein TadD